MEKLEKLAERLSRDFIEWTKEYGSKERIILQGFYPSRRILYEKILQKMRGLHGDSISINFIYDEWSSLINSQKGEYIINLDYYLNLFWFKKKTDQRKLVAD